MDWDELIGINFKILNIVWKVYENSLKNNQIQSNNFNSVKKKKNRMFKKVGLKRVNRNKFLILCEN